MWWRTWTIIGLTALIMGGFPIDAASDSPKLGYSYQSADGVLKSRIAFWIRIYTDLSTSEGLVHDAKYPDVIYEKLDFTGEQNEFTVPQKTRERRIQARIKQAKDFYTKALLSIHRKQTRSGELTPPEKRVFELFRGVIEPNKFYAAAHNKRVRFQLGQKDRFRQGLFYSGRFLGRMERIFRERGVPVEITRLPFVESSFNLRARSKVGASGIWQFMRSTGRLYMRINDTVDERNDPLRATEAAADLLRLNFESLGSWPLAITAYNHGRKGLMRAVRKVGSSRLEEIIDGYRSRSFGFASSNFFAEFIAAAEVEMHSEKYFGKTERDQPVEFAEFVINDYVEASVLSTYTRIPMDTLMDYNPGLTDNVFKGLRRIPSGFTLRVPLEHKEAFLSRYNSIPSAKKFTEQKGPKYDLNARRFAGRGSRRSRQ